MSDPLVFSDLSPASRPVTLAGRDHVLREATAAAAAKFKGAQLRGSTVGKGKVLPNHDALAEANLLLLGLCLVDAETSQSVGTDFVRGLPDRVADALLDALKALSPHLLAGGAQADHERRFVEAAEKLAGLSESEADRRKWRAWMIARVTEAVDSGEAGATPTDDYYPNSRGATTGRSA